MTNPKISRKGPLDDLVLKVCHLELSECRDFAEFKEGIQVMVRNLEETLAALACYEPPSARIRRAAGNVKFKAVHLLDVCRSIPKSFDDPEKWRATAIRIMANYEQFRIQAGHFYQLAVPRSSFGVLRAAL
ncbi:MAG TPA: hypothetical protein VGH51_03110 [Candidatus Angelobacter sp.]|jgi:hypothetical protein